MALNYSNWSNYSDLGQGFAQAPAQNTGGSFWVATLYMLWLIAFALMANFGWEIGLLGASFGATVIGVFLVYLQAMAWQWLIPFVAIDLFMFFYIVWSQK